MIYEHGGDIYSHLEKGVKMLDFSANINPGTSGNFTGSPRRKWSAATAQRT